MEVIGMPLCIGYAYIVQEIKKSLEIDYIFEKYTYPE